MNDVVYAIQYSFVERPMLQGWKHFEHRIVIVFWYFVRLEKGAMYAVLKIILLRTDNCGLTWWTALGEFHNSREEELNCLVMYSLHTYSFFPSLTRTQSYLRASNAEWDHASPCRKLWDAVPLPRVSFFRPLLTINDIDLIWTRV